MKKWTCDPYELGEVATFMGAIAAVVHREKRRAANTICIMLKELSHRGKDAYGIATTKQQVLANSLEKLDTEKTQSNVVLGYVFSKILPPDKPQLITTDNFTIAFDGRTYPPSEIKQELRPNATKTAGEIVKNCIGAYAFAIAASDSLIIGRDTMGVIPLYFARDKAFFVVASERKALWAVGLRKTESFPPGNIAVVKKDGSFSFKPVKAITEPAPKPQAIGSVAKQLQRLLLQSIRDRVSDVKEVAVAFSGGLDSSLVAFLAQKCETTVHLFTVGLEDAPETRHAEDAAKALAMPIHVKTFTVDDVEKVLPRVLWLIEEPNIIQASIAVPLYWTAEHTDACGFDVLLAGQGADELLGGYHRYLGIFAEKGERILQKVLLNDVARCYETNFQRDNQACTVHNVELRLPFTDMSVVNFALGLPLRLKIESPTDKLRKRVLREVAENFGLPKFIVNKPKKAVQYATGVDKALRKLAKRENLNPSDYVRNIFSEAFPDVKPK